MVGAGRRSKRTEARAAQTHPAAGFESFWMKTRAMRSVGLLALLVAVALRAGLFVVGVRNIPPSSDESIMGLQARRIATQFRTPLLMMAQPYMFPLEAYASAPFIRWLPRTAFGVRAVPFVMSCAGVAALLALARRLGGWREIWPVALLLGWTPPYLLMLQGGYALPGYPSLFLLCGVAVWLAVWAREVANGTRAVWCAAAAGFAGGLGCSVTLLAAPVAFMAAGLPASRSSGRSAIGATGAYGVGVFLGLIPHWAARYFFPGAYGAVTQTYAWPDAFARLWEPMLTFTLPAVLGGRFPLFPDNKLTLCLLPGADRGVALLWCAAMVVATVRAVVRNARSVWRDRRLDLDAADVLVGVSWISVFLFAFNRRADGHAYRYLVLTALAFPFVLHGAGCAAGRIGSKFVAGIATVLAILNAAGDVALMRQWSRPGFARDEASLFDIQPAIECLNAQGIRFAYASYHVAYRITFATDERIVCSQYYNERFFGWPLPYKDEVDAASNVAFVLTDAFSLRPSQFDEDLAAMNVRARKESCGDWTIFSEFVPGRRLEFPRLSGGALVATADSAPADAGRLVDGNLYSRWRALTEQAPGLSVAVEWGRPVAVAGAAMYYNAWYQDRPRSLHVEIREGGTWRRVASDVARDLDRFEFLNGHPVLGNQVQTIYWPPVIGEALRIVLAEPEPGRDWAIGEIQVLVEGDST